MRSDSVLLFALILLSNLSCDRGLGVGLPSIAPGDDCPAEGWCWVRGRPLSLGADRTSGAVFAVGAEGAFLRWENESEGWVVASVPTRRSLLSAWVKRADDVWVSDDQGSAWSFDGAAWIERPAEVPILTLTGAPDGSLWAKSSGGGDAHGGALSAGLLRWTGDAWISPMEPYAYCLGAADFLLFESEIWSAGLVCDAVNRVDGVEVRRWDGERWALVGDRIQGQGWYASLSLVEGRVQVQASGRFEWDGATWQATSIPSYPQQLPLDQTALLDGSGYTILPRALECTQALRVDDDRVWCAGAGRIYFHQGSGWSPTLVDPFADTAAPSAWGSIPPNVWAGSDTDRAWGTGPTDVYRVRWSTGRKLEHFDGRAWTIALDDEVFDLDGGETGEVWVTTAEGLLHFDGRAFIPVPLPSALSSGQGRRVHALADRTALMITDDALLAYDDGWSVLREAQDGWRFADVAGSDLADIWLVSKQEGRSNEVSLEHFDGRSWAAVEVAGLAVFGELTTTTDGETWILSGGFVQRLGSNDLPLPMTWRALFASPWIGSDALWISTKDQAQRYPLYP